MTADLTTKYLGLQLANPIVVSACPLTGQLDVLRKLEEFGAAAAVMPSLFEEQLDRRGSDASESVDLKVDNLAYFHELKEYNRGPDEYLKYLVGAKKAVSIPIIGSLNMTGPIATVRYAKRIQEAGADALELNIYFVVCDPSTTSQDIEARSVEIVAAVRSQISIPLAIKISPSYTALPNFARRLVDAGANGLVLFNRFMQPDIDLDTMQVRPRLTLSTPDEVRLPLRWIAILHGRLHASLAATSGAHFPDDCIKLLLAGADVIMVASALYRHGADVLRTLVDGIRYWLEANDLKSLEQIKGSLSQRRCADPAAFERASYTKAIASFLDSTE
jgi:dihydroorotate dehydrogenase (fumarate)